VATSRFRPSARGRVQIAAARVGRHGQACRARPRSRRRATRTSGPGPMCGYLAVARPRPLRQVRGRPLLFTPLAGPKAAIPTSLRSSAATAVTIPTWITARSHPGFSRSAGTTRSGGHSRLSGARRAAPEPAGDSPVTPPGLAGHHYEEQPGADHAAQEARHRGPDQPVQAATCRQDERGPATPASAVVITLGENPST